MSFSARVPVNTAGGVSGNWARPGSSGDRVSRGRSEDVPQLTRVGLGVDAPVGSQIDAVLGSRRAHTAEFRCGRSLVISSGHYRLRQAITGFVRPGGARTT